MAGMSYCLESPSLMKMLDFCLLIPRNEDLELYVSLHTRYPEKVCCVLTLVLFLSAFSSEISSSFSSNCSLHAFNSFVSAANSCGIKLHMKLLKMQALG